MANVRIISPHPPEPTVCLPAGPKLSGASASLEPRWRRVHLWSDVLTVSYHGSRWDLSVFKWGLAGGNDR